MDFKQEQQFVTSIKRYVSENLSLSQINDEELEEKIEEIVLERIGTEYCSIQQRVSIVQQVYSSIRGFGLLDSIISDDTITEVMINSLLIFIIGGLVGLVFYGGLFKSDGDATLATHIRRKVI